MIVLMRKRISSDILQMFSPKISSDDRAVMSSVEASVNMSGTSHATGPTTRRTTASSTPLAHSPKLVRASCSVRSRRLLSNMYATRRPCWPSRAPHMTVTTHPVTPIRPCLLRPSLEVRFRLCCADCTEHVHHTVWQSDILGMCAKQDAISELLHSAPGVRWVSCRVACACVQVVHVGIYVGRPVVCNSVTLIPTHHRALLVQIGRQNWNSTAYLHWRVLVYQIAVYVDADVSNDSVAHG